MATSGTLGHLLNGFVIMTAAELLLKKRHAPRPTRAQNRVLRDARCPAKCRQKKHQPLIIIGKFMTAELCNYYIKVNIF